MNTSPWKQVNKLHHCPAGGHKVAASIEAETIKLKFWKLDLSTDMKTRLQPRGRGRPPVVPTSRGISVCDVRRKLIAKGEKKERKEKQRPLKPSTPMDLQWNPAAAPTEVRGHMANIKVSPEGSLVKHSTEIAAWRHILQRSPHV